MMLAAAFYAACMLLYLVPARRPSTALFRAQRALRVPIHVAVYILANSMFVHHIKLSGMACCSPFVKDYSALEALAAYLLWPALYPAMAAVPLRIAVVLQAGTFMGLYTANAPECAMGQPICSKTDEQYQLFNRVASLAASGLPIGLPMPGELADATTCHNIMTHLKLGMCVVLSFYAAYHTELGTRQAWALQVKRRRLAEELRVRRQAAWRTCGEVALALILAGIRS